tara:strand:+ start:29925 stop:30410 length:486 start_codon:yes stop_codon:yes gene_type:complete
MIFSDNKENQSFIQSQQKSADEAMNILTEELYSDISKTITYFEHGGFMKYNQNGQRLDVYTISAFKFDSVCPENIKEARKKHFETNDFNNEYSLTKNTITIKDTSYFLHDISEFNITERTIPFFDDKIYSVNLIQTDNDRIKLDFTQKELAESLISQLKNI